MAYPIPSRVPLPTLRPYPDYPQPMLANVSAQAPMGVLSDAAPQVAAQQQAMQQPMGFMDKLGQSSDALLAFGSSLLSGRTPNEQWGGGMAALGQGIKDIRSKNLTSEWVKKNAPEYSDLVDAGTITPADVFKLKLSNDYTQRAQAAKQYGLDPTSAEGRNYILTGKISGIDGQGKFGLNPVYGVDKNGNPVIMQMSTTGQVGQAKLPDGVSLSKEPIKLDTGNSYTLLDPITRQPVGIIPKNLAAAKEDEAKGKIQGENIANLPKVEESSNLMLGTIDSILNDENLSQVTGPLQGRLPNFTGASQRVQSKIDQLKGQTFLQAYNTLKGAGQISEIEGAKATDAMARLNVAQSDEDFKDALKELRGIVQGALDRARSRASGTYSNPQTMQRPSAPTQAPTGSGATSSGVKWSVEKKDAV